MTPLYFDNKKGGLVSRDGKLLECCCDDCACTCGESLSLTNGQAVTLNVKFKVFFDPGFLIGQYCINNLSDGNYDPGPPAPFESAPCVDGKYTIRWFDGTYYHDIYLASVDLGGCNCETGANCSYRVCGWKELGSPLGVEPNGSFSIMDITVTNGC